MSCDAPSSLAVTLTLVRSVILKLNGTLYNPISLEIMSNHIHRNLTKEERGIINKGIRLFEIEQADKARAEELLSRSSEGVGNILLFTAYSDDYTIGNICEEVNRLYVSKYSNLHFMSYVAPYKEMLDDISPKLHCTWYKVKMITELLGHESIGKQYSYIMWIDADAMVVDHSKTIDDIIIRSNFRDLIVSEDMHPTCLINGGVLLIRTNAWCRDLFNEVWSCPKYNETFYYEQSTIQAKLRSRQEGLEAVKPFHSFVKGGPCGIKLFAHVAVLPHLELNTNLGWKVIDTDADGNDRYEEECALFIFHAAGSCKKLDALKSIIRRFNIPCDPSSLHEFKLKRGRMGLPYPAATAQFELLKGGCSSSAAEIVGDGSSITEGDGFI